MNNYLKKTIEWQSFPFDQDTQKEVKRLCEAEDEKPLEDAFFKDLEFGTGGMRGVMGVGTNRINKYTIGKNTQGLSNYLKKIYQNDLIKVVIAYDCRINSKKLSQVTADVLSANGIQVFLFSDLRPTPELSFAVRHLNCHAGIMLTASHNPPEYNGYKVYWTDGGQIVPPEDKAIVNEINSVAFGQINFNQNKSLISIIDTPVDESFIKASITHGKITTLDKSNFSLVFTPLHGTATMILPEVLKRSGYNIRVVEKQANPDGYFSTVESPNPENPEALSMALDIAETCHADMVIGTDPDSDRLGIAVRDLADKMQLLTGNQTMILLTKYLLDQFKSQFGFKGNEFIASTIVSTPMISALARAYGVECKLVLTGFRWIAKTIKENPNQKFIGGGEESFGYMVGDFVRDKDAVTSALLACEMANEAKQSGSTLYEELLQCYVDYGFYWEKLISLTKKGSNGLKAIEQMMTNFRSINYKKIDRFSITWVEDYELSKANNLQTEEMHILELPAANVLVFNTEDGSRISIRPSGTEPKIKFYISVRDTIKSKKDFHGAVNKAEAKIARIVKQMELH